MNISWKLSDIFAEARLSMINGKLYVELPGVWESSLASSPVISGRYGWKKDSDEFTGEGHVDGPGLPYRAVSYQEADAIAQQPKRRGRPPKNSDLGRFDEWYKLYPRKVGRGQAEKVWRSINPSDELVDTMVAAIKVQKWDDPQFIPHPSTWLNGKRWMDELPGAQAQQENLPYAGKPWAQFVRTGTLAEVLNLMAQVQIDDAEGIETRLADGEPVGEVCDWLWSFRDTSK